MHLCQLTDRIIVINMALFVHHSPYHFFDGYIADYYRQMAAEMDMMRRRMFQLVPPELLMIPAHDGVCSELEPLVPVVEENGERKMKLEFNVKDYKPEEVKVKMLGDNVLQVCIPLHCIFIYSSVPTVELFHRSWENPIACLVNKKHGILSQVYVRRSL